MIDIIAKEYKGSRENPLPIGRLGENQARRVIFDLSKLQEIYGEGTWKIIAERPHETTPYIVSSTETNSSGNAVWNILSADVGVCGFGMVELRYYPSSEDDPVYKSRLWLTFTEDALGANTGTVTPYNDVIDDVSKGVDEVKAAVKEANEILTNVKQVTVELTKAEYDALSEEKKLDGTIYLVTDENDDIATFADIDIDSETCSLTVNPSVHFAQLRLNGTVEPTAAGYNTIATVPDAHKPLHETWYTGIQGNAGDKPLLWVIRTDGRVQVYCSSSDESFMVYGSGSYFYE